MTYAQNAIKELSTRHSQEELAEILGDYQSNISAYINGRREVSKKVKIVLHDKFGYDLNKLMSKTINDIFPDLIDSVAEKHVISSKALEDAIHKITSRKLKQNKTPGEGMLLTGNDMALVKVTKIDVEGQASLRAAFYAEEYITQNFPTELQQVPKEEAGNHYYEIRVRKDGFSMINKLEPLDWTRSVEIPVSQWNDENIFKKDKIYCLWHPIRGILFKNIINRQGNTVTLHSSNPDKNEYPDEKFHLGEFKKILLVKKIIKDA
ncbi:helix-turn-helix transcriptional regulator [Elizabethkingia meningoseptica]|uniref:helix-turn-helix domain-containing protein n=1 Tax=Elizabethkingia meningoseptica TaxID=238 RepID=UPI0023AF2A37|nr:helix-turn-helix transcriptional regulator [Elizabethkingia meningoseptica]MDE5507717.1 helix-turn-helix transcriptional regulator [Elizabethkingia meningoseptica]